jgi:hypothetical protein
MKARTTKSRQKSRPRNRTKNARAKRQNYRGGSTTVYVPIITIGEMQDDTIYTSNLGVFESEDDGIKALIAALVDDDLLDINDGDDATTAIYHAYKNDTSTQSTKNKLIALFTQFDSTGTFQAGISGWYFNFDEIQTTLEEGSRPVFK